MKKVHNNFWLSAATLAGTLVASQGAQAQSQFFDLSRLSARIGVTTIKPDVDSGDLSTPSMPGSKIAIQSATQLTGGLNYALTEHVSLDLPLGLPFKFDVSGDGTIAGTGKLGDVKALPFIFMAQYRFGDSSSALRPYAGLGINYTRFFKARSTAALTGLTGASPSDPTTLALDNAWGAAAQLGLLVKINAQWSVDLAATYVRLKTSGHLSSGQSIDARLDPTAVTVGAVYQF